MNSNCLSVLVMKEIFENQSKNETINNLTGVVLQAISNLKYLQSIDVSNNHLNHTNAITLMESLCRCRNIIDIKLNQLSLGSLNNMEIFEKLELLIDGSKALE